MKSMILVALLLTVIYPPFLGKALAVSGDVLSAVVQGHPVEKAQQWSAKQAANSTTTTTATTTSATSELKTVAGKAAGVAAKVATLGPIAERTVAEVLGADSLRFTDGSVVKLAQVQSPSSGECYGARAARSLRGLVAIGDRVRFAQDPTLPGKDSAGRLLVVGSASVRFENELRGEYATRFERYARESRAAAVGLWGSCRAEYDPYRDVATSALG
jgi:hypothetical protein